MESGGYDVHFVEEPADYLKCVICHLALRNPVMFIECGHRVCETCFNAMQCHALQSDDAKLLCPHDRIEVDQQKVVDDKGISRVVLDLRVTCSHCEWLGELRDLDKHMQLECCLDNTNKDKKLKQIEEALMELESQKNKEITELKSEVKRRDDRIKGLESAVDVTKERVCVLEKKIQKLLISNDERNEAGSSTTATTNKNNYTQALQQLHYEHSSKSQKILMNVDEYIPDERTVFKWKLGDYYNLRDRGNKVYSAKFYTEPQGICCRLSVGWFGNRKGRFGVFFHVCKGIFGETVGKDFNMEIEFKATGKNGCTIQDTITVDEVHEHLDAFTIQNNEEESRGFGLTHFLNMPALGKYVIDNVLTIECTLTHDHLYEDEDDDDEDDDHYSDCCTTDTIYDSDYDDFLEF